MNRIQLHMCKNELDLIEYDYGQNGRFYIDVDTHDLLLMFDKGPVKIPSEFDFITGGSKSNIVIQVSTSTPPADKYVLVSQGIELECKMVLDRLDGVVKPVVEKNPHPIIGSSYLTYYAFYKSLKV